MAEKSVIPPEPNLEPAKSEGSSWWSTPSFRWNLAVAFAAVFALFGTIILYRSFAASAYGSLPTGAGEIVLQYNLSMVHSLVYDDLGVGAPPAVLLYSNGLMICSDPHASHSGTDASPLLSLHQRQLTGAQMNDLFNHVRSLGFDMAASRVHKIILPPGSAPSIQLNTTKGASTAVRYLGEPEFPLMERYLSDQCARATASYSPDDVLVESHRFDSSNPAVQDNAVAPVVPSSLIPTDTTPATTAVKHLTGSQAQSMKMLIGRSSRFYKSGKDIFKVRVLPKIPDFKAPRPKSATASGQSDKALAAGIPQVRFLYVVAADEPVPASAQANLNDLAATLPAYYQSQVGKSFQVAQVSLVRGQKTIGQYQTCPTGIDCQGYTSLASFLNVSAEFQVNGSATIMLYGWSNPEGCRSYGGPASFSNYDDKVGVYNTGVVAFSDASCGVPDARHYIGAHETGHAFGLAHTCDATLMGACGYSLPGSGYQVPLNTIQAGELRSQSPYFSDTSKRLDVFARGADNQLDHIWWDGSRWLGPEALGGVLTSDPTVTSWGGNRLDTFVRGTDNQMWHKYWNGANWSAWESLGSPPIGALASAPSGASWGPNRIDLFVKGTDNQLWHKWWDGRTWIGWQALGYPPSGGLTSAPSVASWGANRLDVFARGADNQMWHKWWDGSNWSGWEARGGILSSAPSVTSWGPNRLDVFVQGTDNGLYQQTWDGQQWSPWTALGGALSQGPGAVSWGPNRLDIFYSGSDHQLHQKWFDGRWHEGPALGGSLAPGAPAAASWVRVR